MNWRKILGTLLLAGGISLFAGLFQFAAADRFQSTNYTIDASVGDSAGGASSSTNYKLTSAAGESVIGDGSGGSYKLGTGYVAQLAKSLQLTVQPAGQVAYWPLDEDTGAVGWDMSAHANHAQLLQSPASVAGKVSNARDFNGTTQYASVANDSSLNFTTAFTIEAWVKPNAIASSTNYNIVAKSDVGAKLGYRLILSGWGTSNRPELVLGDGTTETISQATSKYLRLDPYRRNV